jgi:hypothetical protein
MENSFHFKDTILIFSARLRRVLIPLRMSPVRADSFACASGKELSRIMRK